MRSTRLITVVDYNPSWPHQFEALRLRLAPAVDSIAAAVEHVGSTSVPGLAAKPIIDMDLVVESVADVMLAIERLKPLGYLHQGNLGIGGREATCGCMPTPRRPMAPSKDAWRSALPLMRSNTMRERANSSRGYCEAGPHSQCRSVADSTDPSCPPDLVRGDDRVSRHERTFLKPRKFPTLICKLNNLPNLLNKLKMTLYFS